MTKADKTKSTKSPEQKQAAIREAKKQFLSGLFDLSWRLFLVFLLPVATGVWLDGDSGVAFTMAGIAIGTIGSIVVIKQVVSEVSSRGGKND